MTLSWLVPSVGGFAVALCAHATACRLPIRTDRVTRFVIVGSATGAGLMWILISRYEMASVETVAAVLVYAFICELYMFVFTMTSASISSNILVQLLPQGLRITSATLTYGGRRMVKQRLNRLVDTGILERHAKGIELTAKGKRLLQTFLWLRQFFRHP